jgi:hypothetical protein
LNVMLACAGVRSGNVSQWWNRVKCLTCESHAQERDVAVSRNGNTDTVRVAVLGASGYTGEEVVRLLALHPYFKVTALTGESQAGKVRTASPLPPFHFFLWGGGMVCLMTSYEPVRQCNLRRPDKILPICGISS